MDTLLHFPPQADVMREQAEAFRRLSPANRWAALFDLIEFGESWAERSPQREAGRRLWVAREREWQAIQRHLFAQYEQRQPLR